MIIPATLTELTGPAYGDSAIGVVKNDPYRLAREVISLPMHP